MIASIRIHISFEKNGFANFILNIGWFLIACGGYFLIIKKKIKKNT
jgi:hypothetical protein